MSDFFDELDTEKEEDGAKKPSSEKEEKRPKKKNGLLKVLIYFLCVLIIGSVAFLVIKKIPKRKDESNTGSNTETKEFAVLSIPTDSITNVNIENSKGPLKLYSEKDASDKDATVKWYVDGVPKDKTSDALVSAVVADISNINATEEITKKTAKECGFSDPEITAEILYGKGKRKEVLIGLDAPIGDGCYLKFGDEDKIYLVNNSIKTGLNVDAIALAKAEMIPAVAQNSSNSSYFDNDQLTTCDEMTVSGKKFPKTVRIVPNTDKELGEYIPYTVVAPEERLADNVDSVFNLFANGIQTTGIYSFYAEDYSRFGLNNPDISLTMKLGNQTYIYKFALQSDGKYAAWCNNGNVIYSVDGASLGEIVNCETSDFYSSIVCLYSIDDLTGLNIKSKDTAYSFDIKSNSDKDSEDKYIITYKGKKIDCHSFQSLYQFIISIPCYDYTTNKVSSTDTFALEFKMKTGKTNTILFTRVDETKYQFSINGKPIGKVASAKLTKMIKYTKKLIDGEKFESLD